MSYPYKRILCPIDLDGISTAAMREATAIARSGNGLVLLLHVVFINPIASEGFMMGKLEESQRRDARTKLEQAAERELRGTDYQLAVEVGDPGDCILAAEKALNADLVVMATHGRRGMARLILGSVAERVVRLSSVPVLTVHPTAEH